MLWPKFGVDRSGPTEGGANFRQVVEESGVALLHGFDALDFDGCSCEAQHCGGHDHPVVTPAIERGGLDRSWMDDHAVLFGVQFDVDAGLAEFRGDGFAPVAFLVLQAVQSGEGVGPLQKVA